MPQAMEKGSGLSDWEQGVLMAVSILIASHDLIVPAADIVAQLGLSEANCSEFDDYDKANLKKIQGDLHGANKLRGL